MKKIINIITLLIVSIPTLLGANTVRENDIITGRFKESDIKTSLLRNQQWVPYPAYSDRAAWQKLTAPFYENIIAQGEKYLDYQWQVVKATDYLAYERNGSRVIMEKPMNENAVALSNLFFAELAEGKGRFLDQIINGVWYFSEMSTWSLSAHVPAYQSSKRSLPQTGTHVVDLMAGDMGSFLSWIHYFFQAEMDKVNPEIAVRLKNNIQERVIDPYMTRTDMWWQAFELTPKQIVNNWNPWCNFNVLTSILLIEDNPEQKIAGIYKTMRSVDKYINYMKADGACDEGPSYWGHAAAKLYDYLEILALATGNKVNLFDQPMIKDMGEYISQSYIGGDNWVVNFADASARYSGEPLLIYRYGTAVKSTEMQSFAKYLWDAKSSKLSFSRDAFRSLENLRTIHEIDGATAALPSNPYKWYPETEFLYIREKGFFFGAKGGFNNESHNHNDLGNFILYLDEQPVFIDAGVGTYNKKTFSPQRYDIWTMQSAYHNVPQINGIDQKDGGQFRTKNTKFDAKKGVFQTDIAGAYPKEAQVNSWIRTYTAKNKSLQITDQFEINNPSKPNVITFMLAAEPRLENGKILLNNDKHTMTYDSKIFDASVEVLNQDDNRLSSIWGEKIYRLRLTAKAMPSKGKYSFTIK